MKRIIKSIIGAVAVTAMVVAGLSYLSQITEEKSSYEKYADFFDQEEDYDVLFMGSSHVLNGIFPMELWETYGIVSYNFGGHGNRLATTYWVMENALDYTTPKLMVIDCYMLERDEMVSPTFESLHISLDAFPLTVKKLTGIYDLLDDSEQRLSFIWNFSTYHSRWLELTEDDFIAEPTTTKGAEMRVNVATANEVTFIDQSQKLEKETVSVEYLRKIIEDCQDRGIDILLTFIPYPASEKEQEAANYVFDIAEEYGVNYLDYHTLLDQVDFSTDCYDADSHLNPSGGKKISDYIGQYIMDNYDIDDQRDNAAYSDWYEDFNDYKETKRLLISEQSSKNNFIMLLYDQSFSSCIFMSEEVDADSTEWNLYKNLGISDEALESDEPRIIYVDVFNDMAECVYLDEELSTDVGTLMLEATEEGYQLKVDGETSYNINEQTLAFVVFDKDTKEIFEKRYGSDLQ